MNWQQFLEDNNIEFVTSGPNTARGEISINCPLCRGNDPSFHLGINLTSGKWACWRDATHKGIAPYRLISALLGTSQAQARLIASSYDTNNPENFNALASALGASQAIEAEPLNSVTFPPEFRPIEAYSLTHKFWKYIWNRGFNNPNEVIAKYGLLSCLSGRWRGRLIIPVLNEKGLVGWQGRALIKPIDAPRYLSSSAAIKQTLFNLDKIADGGEILFVCEGPVDAIKLDFYGAEFGCRAVCSFGVIPTATQISLINEVSKGFSKLVVLFDADAVGPAFGLVDWLPKATFGILPEGAKDPGEMSPTQTRKFIKEAIDGAK